MKTKNRRIHTQMLALLIAVFMAMALLSACGGGNQGGDAQNSGSQNGNAQTNGQNQSGAQGGEDATGGADSEKVLKNYLSNTPATFNCQKTSEDYALLGLVTAHMYESIYLESEERMGYVASIADGDPVCEDDAHKVWTLKVAPGFTFVDGTPIDAHIVEYSQKVLSDPKLANRNVRISEFENGEAYLLGECPWEDVGFKVIDDYTFQITYADNHEPESALDVKGLFSEVGLGMIHPEMFESTLNADGTETTYGSGMNTFVSSGTYDITGLIEGQYLELTKRTDGGAPLTDVYTPDKVEYTVITDSNTRVQLFEQGNLDVVTASQAAYDEYPGARYGYGPFIYGVYVNSINPTQQALKDPNLRYALYWGLDRTRIMAASWPISRPTARYYLPDSTMPDPADKENSVLDYYSTPEAQAVRMDGHEMTDLGYDTALALEYFEKAYEANGSQLINITAIYSDSDDVSKTFAEAIQAQYEDLFGPDRLKITLQAVPWAVLIEQMYRTEMDYDLSFAGGIYNNNEAPWSNSNWVYGGPYAYSTQYCIIGDEAGQEEWSDLYYKCALYDYKWDAQKKLEATARMEEILCNDCSFIPIYQNASRYFFSQKITPLLEVGDVYGGFCIMQAKFN